MALVPFVSFMTLVALMSFVAFVTLMIVFRITRRPPRK